jgi:hypothetical protein
VTENVHTKDAAIAVITALEPLAPEERSRILKAAAALFGITGIMPKDFDADSSQQQNSSTEQSVVKNSKRESIVEFLQRTKAATNPQRIACFAFYREKIEGQQNFSRSDLSGYFAKAKLPAPGKNYSRDFNNAVKEGWVHEDADKSYLTQKGEAAVSAGFDGKAKPRGAPVSKK